MGYETSWLDVAGWLLAWLTLGAFSIYFACGLYGLVTGKNSDQDDEHRGMF